MERLYTIDEVREMIINYSKHVSDIKRMEHARHHFTIGPKAQTYGLESVMPKAQGGTQSDQVYNQTEALIQIDDAIQTARDKVGYVDKRTGRVTGHEKRLVLEHIKDGRSYQDISSRLHISEKTIRDHITAIVWDML